MNNPLLEESSSDSEDLHGDGAEADESETVNAGKRNGGYNREDDYGDEDEEIQEGSDYDDDEQQAKMRLVERIRTDQSNKVKENDARTAKSAHPRTRGKGLMSAKTQYHDLTSD